MSQRILLIVGGGIAAYKSLELVRLLRKAGVEVRAILTRSGEKFVTPMSLAALTNQPVRTDLFDLGAEAEMGHIELSRWADLLVAAPATADLMAKAVHGLADDLASTTLLATDKAVLAAPAMNVRMWTHPATRRNIEQLRADGWRFVGPDDGEMACGEYGPGRLAEPDAIFAAIMEQLGQGFTAAAPMLAGPGPLTGRHVLVTAGPTFEPIDPVRGLTNRSSGKQGYAVAEALARLGARVTLVSGPTALPTPPGVERIDVETAVQMDQAARAALPADAAVCVAAVADWRPETAADLKVKKTGGGATVRLVENPDILAGLSKKGPARPRLVVGFAAETHEVAGFAAEKLKKKGCDWIVANDVGGNVFGSDDNAVSLVTRNGVEAWEPGSKRAIAEKLAGRIAEALA
ncbi:MAG TPA: bifunctional phosphopantothenoylcysteine decarboxylase/phosphopantothenate--cysteine ligase CoaBC [Caulobacteraceae bacterium]|nr:bifunctional phosphopantothenoylcysteine decarboxylase/phosphopantothenate--cysteine ligase CoaBC [Caulobacteraceae bacterium]